MQLTENFGLESLSLHRENMMELESENCFAFLQSLCS